MQAEHGVGQLRGFAKAKSKVAHGHDGRDFFHALDGFNAALRLFGLGRAGFEAVDEFLQVRDFVLLLGKRGALQFELRQALLFKAAVVAGVAFEFAAL